MNLSENIRQQSKMDSRRFGKGIVCRIVAGPLLAKAEQYGLVPSGIYINEETGCDPINYKMLVIPVSVYDTIVELINSSSDLDDALITALQQNIVLVTVGHSMPDGIKSGPPPNIYDVIIDGIDVNQAIQATYVYRSVFNIREKPRMDK